MNDDQQMSSCDLFCMSGRVRKTRSSKELEGLTPGNGFGCIFFVKPLVAKFCQWTKILLWLGANFWVCQVI